MTTEELFKQNLALIERLVATVCRRNGWASDDVEDFNSHVMLKFVADDYALLRKFQGRSSLATYLTVVIRNLFRDYRISRWGKWRPSAAATRLGEQAVAIETLIVRDGYAAAEAVRILAGRGEDVTEAEIEEVLAQVPRRTQRRTTSDAELQAIPAGAGEARRRVEHQELGEAHERVLTGLQAGFARLELQDQTMLRLRYEEGLTVAQIARLQRVDQRPLYRRMHKALAVVRTELAGRGIETEEVRELFGWEGLDSEFAAFDGGKAEPPSTGRLP